MKEDLKRELKESSDLEKLIISKALDGEDLKRELKAPCTSAS